MTWSMKKLINNLIERLTTARESEIIIGDMMEEYNARRKENSKLKADLLYFIDFLTLLTHRVLGKGSSQRSNFFTMLFNYLKVAFRQLGRQRLHNTINIAGLAIGLAVTFLISLYVSQELSYDKFHAKSDRIYLVPMTWNFGTTQLPTALTTAAVGPMVKELFNKEVETYVRLSFKSLVFEGSQGPVVENGVIAVDSTFFDVFTFPLIAGDAATALKEPNSIILTENAVLKYFGEDWRKKDLLSLTLTEQKGKIYKITGIARNPPTTSHFYFEALVSMSSMPREDWEPNWDRASLATYVVLEPGASASDILAAAPDRIESKYGKQHRDMVQLDLVALPDVYLRSPQYPTAGRSDIRYVYIFTIIAALVLIIAIINYMNLSTARSMERAREVGVRKVVGALRLELFWQFISESMLITFTALVIAVGATWLLIPMFNNISGKTIALPFDQRSILILFATWLIISLLGGAYPAAVLSSFRPVKVLKGKLGSIGSGALLRKSLVVFQFGVSIFLIVCTLMINNQLNYMLNKKIGVDKESLIALHLDSIAGANIQSIRNEISGIIGVERSAATSGTAINNGGKTKIYGGDLGSNELLIFNLAVDPGFVKTVGLEIIAGSDLSPEIPKDGTFEYLINESAVKFLGWTNETAVGKRLSTWQSEGTVRGVIRDYHFRPLQKPIEPLLIHCGKNNDGFLSMLMIRVDSENFDGITAAIGERWKKVVPASPLVLIFIDDVYKNLLYRAETRLSRIMNVFSVLAILIASLGLFGLASYTISLRTKELGIRKVLGASLSKLLVAVSGSFMKLVLIAIAIAAPVSWYVMNGWLKNFAYQVEFDWLLVLIAGLMAVVVAAGTITYHAIKAARVNPAVTLRTE